MPTPKLSDEETLLKFPCKFPIKVLFAYDSDGDIDFQKDQYCQAVEAVISKHIKDTDSIDIQTRESRQQKYLSITAKFTARSKFELDTIYQEINQIENTKFIL